MLVARTVCNTFAVQQKEMKFAHQINEIKKSTFAPTWQSEFLSYKPLKKLLFRIMVECSSEELRLLREMKITLTFDERGQVQLLPHLPTSVTGTLVCEIPTAIISQEDLLPELQQEQQYMQQQQRQSLVSSQNEDEVYLAHLPARIQQFFVQLNADMQRMVEFYLRQHQWLESFSVESTLREIAQYQGITLYQYYVVALSLGSAVV